MMMMIPALCLGGGGATSICAFVFSSLGSRVRIWLCWQPCDMVGPRCSSGGCGGGCICIAGRCGSGSCSDGSLQAFKGNFSAMLYGRTKDGDTMVMHQNTPQVAGGRLVKGKQIILW
ncbi:hypothetical protein F5Y16DRAFT_196399 [Xylariaceae sp. FL0255]|nr:hypothetical protein F5Y16DRAFT_196399 [Xylariaceae sp. FL0255]